MILSRCKSWRRYTPDFIQTRASIGSRKVREPFHSQQTPRNHLDILVGTPPSHPCHRAPIPAAWRGTSKPQSETPSTPKKDHII